MATTDIEMQQARATYFCKEMYLILAMIGFNN
jgi:hypothetical protein